MKIIYDGPDGIVSVVVPAPMENFRFLQMTTPSDMQAYADRFIGTPEDKARALRKKVITNDFIASTYGTDEDGVIRYALTEKMWVEYVSSQDIPVGVSREIVEDEIIPSSREYRGAWTKSEKNVRVDMPKARAIHMDRIRVSRVKDFKKIDAEINELEDRGGSGLALRKKRQAMRDVPQNFNLMNAKTPEELTKLWPPVITDTRGEV